MSTSNLYHSLNTELKNENIGVSASELHGFLSGLLAGGSTRKKWPQMVADMLNDGHLFTGGLAQHTEALYQQIKNEFLSSEFEFHLLLHTDNLHSQIEDLVGWVNYFLLGLGLIQPKIGEMKGDIGEVIKDLKQITHLGYDEHEDEQELAFAFEEILEYVRMAAILCHDEFSHQNVTPTLH